MKNKFLASSFLICIVTLSLWIGFSSLAIATSPTPDGVIIGGVFYPNTGLADPATGVKGVLTNFLTWFMGIFGVLALLAFAISGSMYLLSAGSDETIKRAKSAMAASIIGVAVGLSGVVLIKAIDAVLNASQTNL